MANRLQKNKRYNEKTINRKLMKIQFMIKKPSTPWLKALKRSAEVDLIHFVPHRGERIHPTDFTRIVFR